MVQFCHTTAGGPVRLGPRLEASVTLRSRLALALVGLTFLCLAAVSLAYRWWPLRSERDEFRPAPTLFSPPAGISSAGERQ